MKKQKGVFAMTLLIAIAATSCATGRDKGQNTAIGGFRAGESPILVSDGSMTFTWEGDFDGDPHDNKHYVVKGPSGYAVRWFGIEGCVPGNAAHGCSGDPIASLENVKNWRLEITGGPNFKQDEAVPNRFDIRLGSAPSSVSAHTIVLAGIHFTHATLYFGTVKMQDLNCPTGASQPCMMMTHYEAM